MLPIQKLITEGRTEEAIQLLIQTVPDHQKEDAMALQANFKEVRRNERLGILSFQEASREKNRINLAVLDLVPKDGNSGSQKEVHGKNIVMGSTITAGGNVIIGDSNTVNQNAGKIYNIKHIENADFSDKGTAPAPMPDKQKILFIAANPDDQERIKTDLEHRRLIEQLKLGRSRDKFEFLPVQLAVTTSNLIRAFNDKPNIVHFSGHSSKEGLLVTNEDNRSVVIPLSALKRLFRPLQGVIEIAIFNACWTSEQAKAISEFGMYVVGNRLPIADEMAICFSKGFYNGLGEGKDFEGAFNDAMIMVETECNGKLQDIRRSMGFQNDSEEDNADIIEVWKDGVKLDL